MWFGLGSRFFIRRLYAVIFFIQLLTGNAYSQHFNVDEETGKFSISKVIFLDSLSKSEIFNRAGKWLDTSNEAKVILSRIVDENSGKYVCEISKNMQLSIKGKENNAKLNFTFIIEVIGGRCRYEFTDLVFDDGAVKAEKKFKSRDLNKEELLYLNKTKRIITALENSLIAAMSGNNSDIIVRKYQRK